MFSDNPILVFLLLFYLKIMFSLCLALLKEIQCPQEKQNFGNWVATKQTASGETSTQCPNNLLQS